MFRCFFTYILSFFARVRGFDFTHGMAKKTFGDLFSFGQAPFLEALTDHAIIGGSAVAGQLGWELGVEQVRRIPFLDVLPEMVYPVAELVAGSIVGPMLATMYPRVGLGVGVGMASNGVNRLVRTFLADTGFLPELAGLGYSQSLGQSNEQQETLLLGDSSQEIETVESGLGFGDSAVEVEDVEPSVGSWIGG